VRKALTSLTTTGQHTSPIGAELYYEVFAEDFDGSTPALVLHGGMGFIGLMYNQIAALTKTRKVIAMDLRGHGRSRDVEEALTYAAFAEDVLSLLDHLTIKRVDVIGWGDGGTVGLYLAIHAPDRVRKLVTIAALYDHSGATPLLDSNLDGSDANTFEEAKQAYQRLSPTPENWSLFEQKLIRLWENEPRFSEMQLTNIRTAVLVIAGEDDEIVKLKHCKKMATRIPNAKLLVVASGTHYMPFDNPDAVNGPMLKFLTAS